MAKIMAKQPRKPSIRPAEAERPSGTTQSPIGRDAAETPPPSPSEHWSLTVTAVRRLSEGRWLVKLPWLEPPGEQTDVVDSITGLRATCACADVSACAHIASVRIFEWAVASNEVGR